LVLMVLSNSLLHPVQDLEFNNRVVKMDLLVAVVREVRAVKVDQQDRVAQQVREANLVL